ncbi:sulfotransferase family protein [Aspergillus alliaceus]|nr:P-loop containing nucleoside triphosphate hydrolase protein [Aspergillus alliaceus]KAB8236949.1 P-loop containing nucleoside triphosphate hydrolase protein [Aspergillus alliaceus]
MPRLIDLEPNRRTKPMRILCLGLTRTGTNSLVEALRKLGYNPYHGSECFNNPPRDFNLWIEAMQCNFFNDDPTRTPRYGREEFDRLIGSYDACLDIPASMFWEDLYQAYPDAKVILTTRDIDAWWKSMDATLFGFMRMPFFRYWRYLDRRVIGPLYSMYELVWRIFCGNCYEKEVCQRAFLDHYERVREAIPKERILELRVGRDGWEELCRFLDVPVPGEPWPRAYPTAAFQEHVDIAFRGAVGTLLTWGALGVVVFVGVLWIGNHGGSFHDEV